VRHPDEPGTDPLVGRELTANFKYLPTLRPICGQSLDLLPSRWNAGVRRFTAMSAGTMSNDGHDGAILGETLFSSWRNPDDSWHRVCNQIEARGRNLAGILWLRVARARFGLARARRVRIAITHLRAHSRDFLYLTRDARERPILIPHL
jgi:hypothetical protein